MIDAVKAKLDLLPARVHAPSSGGRSQARRHLIDNIAAAALLGDTVSVVCGMVMAFWIRFDSGWITFGVESHPKNLDVYLGPFGIGLLFFYLTFYYLRFY